MRAGVLLSGGLDSSLVASIAARAAGRKGQKLLSFCVGLEGSPDLAAAQQVAEAIGTQHTAFTFSVQVRGRV
jgi:asparagine synthase (glutamine-hydrolysing)